MVQRLVGSIQQGGWHAFAVDVRGADADGDAANRREAMFGHRFAKAVEGVFGARQIGQIQDDDEFLAAEPE